MFVKRYLFLSTRFFLLINSASLISFSISSNKSEYNTPVFPLSSLHKRSISDIVKKFSLKVLAGENALDKEVYGCYVGDLLSGVLGNAKPKDIWVTVMGNINAIGVASMIDASCIILAERAWLDDNAKHKANEHNIAVLSSTLSSYKLISKLSEILEYDPSRN